MHIHQLAAHTAMERRSFSQRHS